MTENFKESIDKGNTFGALLTDLSKAFDCIDHTVMIAKLFAFRVSPLSLKLIYFCLSNWTQRIKINKNFSDRTNIEFNVPQSSVLRPLLFNIDMTDLFYECEDSEAVVSRCSVEKMFLEISKNLQENTCARDSFLIKLTKGFSCEFCKISKNTFIYRTPPVAPSEDFNVAS